MNFTLSVTLNDSLIFQKCFIFHLGFVIFKIGKIPMHLFVVFVGKMVLRGLALV